VIAKRWYTEANLADTALVILHPNLADQHLLLPIFLNRADRTPICLTAHASAASFGDFWDLLATGLAEQTGVQLPPLGGKSTPESAASAALKALKPIKHFVLAFDAMDIVEEPVLNFLIALVNELPEGSQVVVGGRQVPIQLLSAFTDTEKVAIFPVDSDRMLLDYAARDSGRHLLEVYGHGHGRVLVDGRVIDQWDGVLPRSLFFYFVDRGMVTRDEIFTTFWPDLPVKEATNVFHVTKRKISEILGFDLTVYWSGFYRITPNIDLHYDVVKFAENVQNAAVASNADATVMLQRALALYQGTFLSTIDLPWIKKRRDDLQSIYVEALTSLARLNESKRGYHEALGLYLRAAGFQPLREDLARSIMSLYRKLEQPGRALEIYDQLAADLKAQLNVPPDRRTVELADQIRSKKPAK